MIVDTDLSLGAPGSEIDDGLALAMVVAEPRLDLQAVTTVSGNVDAASAASLVLDLFERLDVHDVPVFKGGLSALCDPVPRRPSVPAGRDEDGVTTGYAAAEIARRVVESPGEITVIAIGPLTNLAVAITIEPGFAAAVKEIVVMGGTYFRNLSWGSLPSEFNFWLDPEAAKVVLRSGAKLRLVGLDVTTQVPLSRADATMLQNRGGRFAAYAGTCAQAWIERLATEYPGDPDTGDSCSMHDPVAVAAAVRPDLLEWKEVYVDIVTHDQLGRGVAVVDRLEGPASRSPNCSVAAGVDSESIRAYALGLLLTL
ncbi:nucleoside hydrolase [Cryptosporangium sp. NPDC051539]|uniref:nucleoside hydrolase n=1 Tax=Cryptosporangium sp. NPDC051539 TaxID=3363962 RepID=UPI0037B63BFE